MTRDQNGRSCHLQSFSRLQSELGNICYNYVVRLIRVANLFRMSNSACPTEAIAALKSPFIQDDTGRSLLHFVCDEGYSDDLLSYLIDTGIPVNSKDNDGNTALHRAAFKGRKSLYKMLLSHGADINAKNRKKYTPLCMATKANKPEMVAWILKQQEKDAASRFQWDDSVFANLMEFLPDHASSYLDMFAIDHGPAFGTTTTIEYFDLHLIYGRPVGSVAQPQDSNKMMKDSTALSVAVANAFKKNVLNHRALRHIMSIKWKLLRYIFYKELKAYLGLLISYYATIIFGDPDWIDLKNTSDYGVMVMRAISWLCCLYLVVFVEYSEFKGGQYFESYWNWLNMTTYGGILASIPLEFFGGSTNTVRNGLLSIINVLLWVNLLQYMTMHKKIGLLITTMGRMIHDVSQFLMLYLVFLLGFSSALHLILHGAIGYDNYLQTLITVLLMLFGNITYDPYEQATGWKWAFSNLLLFVYLISVVVMLLNVLIAMLSTSHNLISESAEEQYYLHKAETILRIERTVSKDVRKAQYERLLPPDVKSKLSTNHSTLSSDADNNADIEQQNNTKKVVFMGDIPVELYDRHDTSKAIRTKNKTLFCLEDGLREVKADSKQRGLSPEMEARLESLQASVKEEMAKRFESLQDFVIKEMESQSRVLAAAIVKELQKSMRRDIGDQEPEQRHVLQALPESIDKTEDVRAASLLH